MPLEPDAPQSASRPADLPQPPPVQPSQPTSPVTPVPHAAAAAGGSYTAGTRRGAVLWGVALISVGALLLINQFAPSVAIWRYWPLIIVVIGVRAMLGPSSGGWSVKHAAEGLVTVTIGLVFLGQMLGYLGWNVWLNILRLWPLLLISIGIEIAGKGLRSDWLRALGSLVIVAGLAYGALVMTPTGDWRGAFVVSDASEPFSMSEPHDRDVDEGTALVRGGAGVLSITDGRDLASAAGRSPFTPEFEAEVADSRADVKVGLGSGSWVPGMGEVRLDVELDRSVAWDLAVETGVSSYDVDLRDLPIRELSFDAGVSEGRLTLGTTGSSGARGPVDATIKIGVSALTLRVPQGESVRVAINEGLSGVNTRGAWTSSRDGSTRIHESEGFNSSGSYWDIEVQSGIGSITIEYY